MTALPIESFLNLTKFNTIQNIKLIFGLGNPGAKYKNQRHNVGMNLCEKIAELQSKKFNNVKSFSYFENQNSSNKNYIFAKSESFFMNDSGKVLKELIQYFKLKPNEILIVHDELEIKFGFFKFGDGSAKGHNGIKSIFSETGFQNCLRLKIGIGRPENREDVQKYVLNNFSQNESIMLESLFINFNNYLFL